MKIAIVGGGITGLSAAYFLSQKHQVVLFERTDCLGGIAGCFKQKDWLWSLEKYYHHVFASDKEVVILAKSLGIEKKLFFQKPLTSIFIDGQIYAFDNPKSIMQFPKLNFFDKLFLGGFTVLMKINPCWKPLEKITAFQFIQKLTGKKNFILIWKPLLESKFGIDADKIPASFIWTRIKKRSFSLGYFEGGNQTLIDKLTEKIKENQGEIQLKKEVTKIQKTNDCFEIFTHQKKYPEKFDKVIAAVSPTVLTHLFPSLSEKEKLNRLKSLGSLCLVLELKQSFLNDKTYWLNINDPGFPFVAVVEHTNFIDKKYYDNHVLLYVGGYYPIAHPFFKMTKEQLLKEYLPFLKKINPYYDFPLFIIHCSLFTDPYTQPIPSINYSQTTLPSIQTSIPGLFWASLHHIYPQDRGINYAILLGKKLAKEVNKITR